MKLVQIIRVITGIHYSLAKLTRANIGKGGGGGAEYLPVLGLALPSPSGSYNYDTVTEVEIAFAEYPEQSSLSLTRSLKPFHYSNA